LIKRTFFLLLLTFFSGIILGVAYSYLEPGGSEEFLLMLFEELGPLSENAFDNFTMIFTHNVIAAFLVLVSGLFFGLGPWLMVAFNGLVVGIVVGFLVRSGAPVEKIVLGIVPHGVFEIPAFILAGTAGIVWYESIKNSEEPAKGFKEGMKKALKLYALTVGMLLIAALVEAYVTPKVAGL